MSYKYWERFRGFVAYIGLAVPLLPMYLTRHRTWFGIGLGLAAFFAIISNKRAPGVRRFIIIAYLVTASILAILSKDLLLSAATDAWLRAAATATALVIIFILEKKNNAVSLKLKQWLGDALGEIAWNVLFILAVALVYRFGQHGLWTNPSIVSAILVTFPVIHFRPRRVALIIFVFCSTIVIYEWHGYFITSYVGRTMKTPPAGVKVNLLSIGNPQKYPGARIFVSGRCDMTNGSFYIGDAKVLTDWRRMGRKLY